MSGRRSDCELSRRAMQILGYVGRHEGESYSATRIGCVLDMDKDAVNVKLRNLRDIGLVDFSSGKRLMTAAGRKMLWSSGDRESRIRSDLCRSPL